MAEITARAITPVAIEMLDGVMLRMVEEATHAGYPMDAAAVLLIELEGLREAVEEQIEQIREACLLLPRARVSRGAKRAEERELLVERPQERVRRGGPRQSLVLRAGWRGAAHANRADAALHRTKWPSATGSRISNIFHAGDGNLHPIILFDPRMPGELEQGEAGERRDSRITAFRWAARSPASTAWEWRRWK